MRFVNVLLIKLLSMPDLSTFFPIKLLHYTVVSGYITMANSYNHIKELHNKWNAFNYATTLYWNADNSLEWR